MAANQPANGRTVILKDEGLRQFEGGFTSIPNRILENNDLTLGARMTYAMLLKYAWQKDFCFPAQQQLAKDLGITDRSVRTFLTELRDRELIDWKQQGLNRPNIYYILKLPERVSPNGNPGPENISGPDRKPGSAQDRKPASDKEYSTKNTQVVVNDVTDNDRKNPSKTERPSAGKKTATISDRALRSTYQLDDTQIGRVHWLVQKQAEILGAAERNHGHYVKRAAEAVRDGQGELLDQALGDFKQAATEIAVGSRPAYFHAMWGEALQKHAPSDLPLPTGSMLSDEPTRIGESFGHLFGSRRQETPVDPDGRIARMIADAEKRGVAVPQHIRASLDPAQVSRWWATVVAEESRPRNA